MILFQRHLKGNTSSSVQHIALTLAIFAKLSIVFK